MGSPPQSVLIVEDADVVRTIAAHYVDTEADLHVLAAVSSGRAALQHAQRHCPDLVLLDHEMADGAGLEVLPALRQQCPKARIVMFSAYPEVRDEALESGADEFISKERPLHEVVDALRAH